MDGTVESWDLILSQVTGPFPNSHIGTSNNGSNVGSGNLRQCLQRRRFTPKPAWHMVRAIDCKRPRPDSRRGPPKSLNGCCRLHRLASSAPPDHGLSSTVAGAARSLLHLNAGPHHAPALQRLDDVAIIGRTQIAVAGGDQVRCHVGLQFAQPAVPGFQLDETDLATPAKKHQMGNPGVTPMRFSLVAVAWSRFSPLAICVKIQPGECQRLTVSTTNSAVGTRSPTGLQFRAAYDRQTSLAAPA